MRLYGGLALLASCLLTLTGCSAPAVSEPAPGEVLPPEEVTLTVSAAASLQRPFNEIAELFATERPDVQIAAINYDGSSTLAMQILAGAPVDVFVSADKHTMQFVVDEGFVESPTVFASNTLVIAVPRGNPAGVAELSDLARVTTVLCAPEVPCGAASERLLAQAGVRVTAASLEQNVTSVLQKVAAGEADAGLVYRTDIVGDRAVEGVTPVGADGVVNSYPIAVIAERAESVEPAEAERRAAARAFVDFVLGVEGQRVLSAHGFGGAVQ